MYLGHISDDISDTQHRPCPSSDYVVVMFPALRCVSTEPAVRPSAPRGHVPRTSGSLTLARFTLFPSHFVSPSHVRWWSCHRARSVNPGNLAADVSARRKIKRSVALSARSTDLSASLAPGTNFKDER
jgi:hypothetical protein